MTLFLLLKAAHLIAMVAWFAALFYLPRLFVYMREAPKAAPTLHLMARKLSHFIMVPAAFATWAFGLMLALTEPQVFQMGWLHAKLGLVLLLSAYTASLEYHRMALLSGQSRKSAKFFRLYNEVPTVFLILIIGLAVLKPF